MKPTTTPVVATATAKPKQYTFGISETHKEQFTDFRKEFNRPAAVKNAPAVPMSEKELLEVLFQVATDRRFKTVEVMETVEVDGESFEVQAMDSDGNPKFETIDLIDQEWEKIKVRDYSEQVSKTPTIDGLIASIRKTGKILNLSVETIESMIATATAGQAAQAAEAETAAAE